MAATEAVAAFGTVLKLGDGGETEVFTSIGEVTDLNHSGYSATTEDATHHESPSATMESIATLIDPGSISGTLNWVPGDTANLAVEAAMKTRAKKNFEMSNTTMSRRWIFAGIVTSFDRAFPVQGKATATFEIRITGPVTEAAIS
jgi:hypothetical protein